MNLYAINKYPPRLYKKGRFLREGWTSCSDVGKQMTHGGILSREEYLRVEGLYVAAVEGIVNTIGPDAIRAHDIEFWEAESQLLADLGLEDVFDESPRPTEGEPVAGARLANVVRRCLREVAWLELAAERRLLVHFGYDLRMFVASSLPLNPVLETVRASGLFVYDSEVSLPTLRTWPAE